MVVNDNAGSLPARGVWSFIASRLAPTGDVGNIDHPDNIQHKNHVSFAPRLITHPRGQFV